MVGSNQKYDLLRPASPRSPAVAWSVGTCLVLLIITVLITWFGHVFHPALTQRLLSEDSSVENATAASFLLASGLAVATLRKSMGHRAFLWTIVALGLLGFLDEISFGERLFGLTVPSIAGIKIDAVHDFFALAFKTRASWACPGTISCYYAGAVAALAVFACTWFFRHRVIAGLRQLREKPHWFLLVLFLLLLFAALIIDLHLVHNELVFAMEEVLELNAALLLSICCLYVYSTTNPVLHRSR